MGPGYVGLVAAICFAEMGHDVVRVDNDQRKVDALGNLCTGKRFSWCVRGFGEFIGFGDDCVALCAG